MMSEGNRRGDVDSATVRALRSRYCRAIYAPPTFFSLLVEAPPKFRASSQFFTE